MFTRMMCAAVSVASAATLSLLGAGGASASQGATPHGQHPAQASPAGAAKVLAASGTQLWVKRYNGPGWGAGVRHRVEPGLKLGR